MRDKLIIIDDNELDLAILNEIFKNNFNTKCFSSTAKALGYIHNNQSSIAVILLDICLGRSGAGFNVLEHIKRQKSLSTIPVILITSDAHEDYVQEGIQIGAIDFLVKPVDPHAVTKRVNHVVENFWPSEEICIGQENISELKNDEEIEYSIDEIKKIAKCKINEIQALCKIKNTISIELCMDIHKLTYILGKSYIKNIDSNLQENDIDMISYASIFFDIGRLGIPDENIQSDFDSFLSKPYSQHISIGQNYFSSNTTNSKFYRYCSEITYWHHKNIDGSGYPDDVVNVDIPISAQLVRTALRFYFYAERFKFENNRVNRILNSLSSEINHTISYQMYDTVQKALEELDIFLNESNI